MAWPLSVRRALAVCIAITSTGWTVRAQEPTRDQEEKPVVFDTVEVTAPRLEIPILTAIERERLRSTPPVGDGSEVLRDLPGADLGRMGGHGLELFLRGLSQGDLTVLLDGATVHGGCPNRMDPATSFAAAETSDRVEVIRGVQTLRYGPGAPGGTVRYVRRLPGADSPRWRAELSTGGSSWSDGPELAADSAFRSGSWSLRVLASARDAGSYEDGDGVEVRSAARSRSAALMAGWRGASATVELSLESATTRDALFAGAGMDSPESTADVLRLRSERSPSSGRLGWQLEAFSDTVDHQMDNFSLRPLTAPMALAVPSETSTWGFRGHLNLAGAIPLLVGASFEEAVADATRFSGSAPEALSVVQSILWPDVHRLQGGVFVEAGWNLSPATSLVAGARVDLFTAEARRADEPTQGGNGPTPRQLWARYTGMGEQSRDDTGVGGLIRLEHRRGSWTLHGGLSRTVRVADATERFLAANSPAPSQRWIGNPGLRPARHHQLDLGARWSSGPSTTALDLFAAAVDDLILRDRAHGQAGIFQGDSATVYRNVEARRYGFELTALTRLGYGLDLHGSASWVWAENTTDGRPIAQTPPLRGAIGAGWAAVRWSAAGTLRWAARQSRVDDDPATGSGVDAGPTPGWAVLDLDGSVDLGGGLRLQLGLENAFDRTYATHLNRASLFDPDPVRVNEPGRTWWLRLRWRSSG